MSEQPVPELKVGVQKTPRDVSANEAGKPMPATITFVWHHYVKIVFKHSGRKAYLARFGNRLSAPLSFRRAREAVKFYNLVREREKELKEQRKIGEPK